MADPQQWYILRHAPGPAVPEGTSVFDHAGVSEHFAFLRRRAAAGELVAAGPIADESGEGMTLLAVGSLEEAVRLATEDDRAVVDGVFTVEVRPWRVVMTGD